MATSGFSLKYLFFIVAALLAASFGTTSCIEDGITTSPTDQPEFSTDTLKMGDVFTGEDNPTFTLMVYNRHDKILNINSIKLQNNESVFKLNVDGLSGSQFNNIETRPNDSIYIFVATALPVNGHYRPTIVSDVIEFITNGVTSSVVVTAEGTDVDRHKGVTITADTYWEGDRPRQIFDSLVVAPDAKLTIAKGAKLYFHDGAQMIVKGTLITEGEAGSPVEFCGDRTGNVITDVTFDLMSRQWEGITFTSTSRNSKMAFTEVRNTWSGVTVDSTGITDTPTLTLTNCRMRNAAYHVLQARHSSIAAYASEFAEAGYGPVDLTGGNHTFANCTFSNYYLFSAIMGPLVNLNHVNDDTDDGSTMPRLSGSFTNCILYGSGTEMSPGDLTGTSVTVNRCLLRSKGSDDDNFINCIWGEDPLFYTVRADYIFDYRLKPESPAIGQAQAGFESLIGATDFYGAYRSSYSLGAYEPYDAEQP